MTPVSGPLRGVMSHAAGSRSLDSTIKLIKKESGLSSGTKDLAVKGLRKLAKGGNISQRLSDKAVEALKATGSLSSKFGRNLSGAADRLHEVNQNPTQPNYAERQAAAQAVVRRTARMQALARERRQSVAERGKEVIEGSIAGKEWKEAKVSVSQNRNSRVSSSQSIESPEMKPTLPTETPEADKPITELIID